VVDVQLLSTASDGAANLVSSNRSMSPSWSPLWPAHCARRAPGPMPMSFGSPRRRRSSHCPIRAPLVGLARRHHDDRRAPRLAPSVPGSPCPVGRKRCGSFAACRGRPRPRILVDVHDRCRLTGTARTISSLRSSRRARARPSPACWRRTRPVPRAIRISRRVFRGDAMWMELRHPRRRGPSSRSSWTSPPRPKRPEGTRYGARVCSHAAGQRRCQVARADHLRGDRDRFRPVRRHDRRRGHLSDPRRCGLARGICPARLAGRIRAGPRPPPAGISARSSAARTACAPSSVAATSLNCPPKLPPRRTR